MLRQLTSLQHPLVKHLVKLRQNRDYRYEHQSLVVEGLKPVSELSEHAHFKTLVAWNETMLPKGATADEVVLVGDNIMKKISGMQSPEGLLAEIEMPKPASLKGLRRIIAFDGVSDPGNLGTLLRTALALGWEGAFVLEDSCDPFNEKALRSARGATFRLPIAFGGWQELRQLIADGRLEPFVADLKGIPVDEAEASTGVLLVLGNEAHGASNEVKKVCKSITIPMSRSMESLNVSIAGGILMYALRST